MHVDEPMSKIDPSASGEFDVPSQGNMCVHPEVSKEGDRERVDEPTGPVVLCAGC